MHSGEIEKTTIEHDPPANLQAICWSCSRLRLRCGRVLNKTGMLAWSNLLAFTLRVASHWFCKVLELRSCTRPLQTCSTVPNQANKARVVPTQVLKVSPSADPGVVSPTVDPRMSSVCRHPAPEAQAERKDRRLRRRPASRAQAK